MRTLLFVFVLASVAFAEQTSEFTFVQEPVVVPADLPAAPFEPVNYTGPAADIDIATIIAIGKAVWEFIKENKPVVNYKTDWAGAIPKGLKWTDLEGFKDTQWGPFSWVFKNVYGVEVVQFKWKFAWTCKGSYQGHGKFIVNAGAAVEKIYAAWGFTVNVDIKVDQTPTNYGSKVDPIAGLNIDVSIEVKTVIQTNVAHCRVNVRGDCSGKKVACS